MIKKIIILSMILLSLVGITVLNTGNTSAVSLLSSICSNSSAKQHASTCQDSGKVSQNSNPIIGEIKIAINILSFIIGIVSIVIIIISGLRIVLGGSDPQTISSARDAIIYAMVGIVVVVVSQALVVFVLDKIK